MHHPLSLPAPDVIAPSLFVVGPLAVAAVFLGIPLLEAAVLQVFKWGRFRQAYRDTFLANLTTTLLGLVLLLTLRIDPTTVFWVLAFLLSVVIEGLLLTMLRHHPARRTWPAALAANLVSYAACLVLLNSF